MPGAGRQWQEGKREVIKGANFQLYKIRPRDLGYGIVPIVNSILHTLTFAERVDLMLSILITKKKNGERKLEGNRYIYDINCVDSFIDVYLSPKSSGYIY